MAYISDYKYYEEDNGENFGSSQYIKLSEIVNNFMLMYVGNHEIINNIPRYKVLFHAKRAIQELHYDAMRDVKVLEQSVTDRLQVILPSDYVNYVRISMYKDNILFPLVENMQKQGRADLLQAGGSMRKAGQSTMAEFYRGMSELSSTLQGRQRQAALKMAELGVETSLLEKKLGIQMESIDNAALSSIADAQFNMRVLDADVASAVAQSERNMQAISLQKYGADLNAAAQVMIKPQRLSYSEAPSLAPERIFVKPMKVLPGAVAQPVQQSVWGPLVGGIASAAQGAMQAANIHYAKNS